MASNHPQDNVSQSHIQFPILTATQSHSFTHQQPVLRPLLPAPPSASHSSLPLVHPPGQQPHNQQRHHIPQAQYAQQISNDPRSSAQSPTNTSAVVPRTSPAVPHPQHHPQHHHPPPPQNILTGGAQSHAGSSSYEDTIVEEVSNEVKQKLKDTWTATCVAVRTALQRQGGKFQDHLTAYANNLASTRAQLDSVSTELSQVRQQRDDAVREKDRIMEGLSTTRRALEAMTRSRDEYGQRAAEIGEKWSSYFTTAELSKRRMESELAALREKVSSSQLPSSSKSLAIEQSSMEELRKTLSADLDKELNKKINEVVLQVENAHMKEASAKVEELEKELAWTRKELEEATLSHSAPPALQTNPVQLATPGSSESEHAGNEEDVPIIPPQPFAVRADSALGFFPSEQPRSPTLTLTSSISISDAPAINPEPTITPLDTTKFSKTTKSGKDDVEVIDLTDTPRTSATNLPGSPRESTPRAKPAPSSSVTSPRIKRALSPPPIAVLQADDASSDQAGPSTYTSERPQKRSKVGSRTFSGHSGLPSPLPDQVSIRKDQVGPKDAGASSTSVPGTPTMPSIAEAVQPSDWETGSVTTLPSAQNLGDLELLTNKLRVEACYELKGDMYNCNMCVYRNLPKTQIPKSRGGAKNYEALIKHWTTSHGGAWRSVLGMNPNGLIELAQKFSAGRT